MKIISRYLVICLAILCWGCSAEMVRDGSFTLNPNEFQSASGTLKGSDNQCLQTAITGTFATKDAQTGTAFIIANVNVLVPGTYAISTDKQNGVTFAAAGKFTATGIQQIKLLPVGIFEQAIITNYTLSFGNTSCPLAINVTEGTGAGNPGTDPGTGNPGTGNPNTGQGTFNLTINGKSYTGSGVKANYITELGACSIGNESGTYLLDFGLPLTNNVLAQKSYKSTDLGPELGFQLATSAPAILYVTGNVAISGVLTYNVTSVANNTVTVSISGTTMDMSSGSLVNVSGTITAPLQ